MSVRSSLLPKKTRASLTTITINHTTLSLGIIDNSDLSSSILTPVLKLGLHHRDYQLTKGPIIQEQELAKALVAPVPMEVSSSQRDVSALPVALKEKNLVQGDPQRTRLLSIQRSHRKNCPILGLFWKRTDSNFSSKTVSG
jgi:hypothetical protein